MKELFEFLNELKKRGGLPVLLAVVVFLVIAPFALHAVQFFISHDGRQASQYGAAVLSATLSTAGAFLLAYYGYLKFTKDMRDPVRYSARLDAFNALFFAATEIQNSAQEVVSSFTGPGQWNTEHLDQTGANTKTLAQTHARNFLVARLEADLAARIVNIIRLGDEVCFAVQREALTMQLYVVQFDLAQEGLIQLRQAIGSLELFMSDRLTRF